MNGVSSRRSTAIVLGVAAVAVGLAGCSSDSASPRVPTVAVVESAPQDWFPGDRPVLRSQADTVGGRLWVLTADGVELYEAQTRRRVAQIALPDWLWVGEKFACPPDLAIGPRGEAVISSNILPTLWQINPVTLKVSRHELALDDDNNKDVGFTGLAYSTRYQAFFAVSALHGTMWRIDPALQRAQHVALSEALPNACGLAIRRRATDERASRVAGFCVGAEPGGRGVDLAPHQRSGYVRPGPCAG